MLGKPNGSIGKWGRVIRVNDGDPAQLIDQVGAGRLQEWRQNGTAKAYLDNSGNLTIAGMAAIIASQATGDLLYASSATAMARLAIGATDSFLTVQGGLPVWSNALDPVWVIGGANTTPRVMRFQKSRGTVASPTVLTTGDILGDISFDGYVNAHFVQAGLLRFMSEGTIGTVTDRMPSVFEVWVNTDASPSVLTKRLSINSAGLITFPTATAEAAALLIGGGAYIWAATAGRLTFQGDGTAWLQVAADNTITLRQYGSTKTSLKLSVLGAAFGLDAQNGQSNNRKILTELTTIAAAATTDTAIQIPLNCIVYSVSVYTETVIPTAATYTVTGATTGTQFNRAAVGVAAGSSDVGNALCPYNNGAAQAIRITPNATPGAATGKVRVTISYEDVTVPTS